jgi:hypothetical protein
VPAGATVPGAVSNVSSNDTTLRLLSCSTVVGCNAPSANVVVLGASVSAIFISPVDYIF